MKAATLSLLALLVGFSTETPADLGRYAALNEVAYGKLGDSNNYRAGQFMAAWYRACQLARDEMSGSPFMKTLGDDAINMAKAIDEFNAAYIDGLKSDPKIAAAKPLQRLVQQNWWRNGTGCAGVLKDTPRWAND